MIENDDVYFADNPMDCCRNCDHLWVDHIERDENDDFELNALDGACMIPGCGCRKFR